MIQMPSRSGVDAGSEPGPAQIVEATRMFHDRTFTDERVILDGGHFVRCRFEGTTLVYFGGRIPELERCWFDNVRFSFEGPAMHTVELLRKLREKGVEVL